mmetsp:Transcript_1690/g.3613  ORF Transcript_1690/g.3613 Transcript_1690/m.3613 type:complete len:272 (+) Transcript_1690:366-1181(+)
MRGEGARRRRRRKTRLGGPQEGAVVRHRLLSVGGGSGGTDEVDQGGDHRGRRCAPAAEERVRAAGPPFERGPVRGGARARVRRQERRPRGTEQNRGRGAASAEAPDGRRDRPALAPSRRPLPPPPDLADGPPSAPPSPPRARPGPGRRVDLRRRLRRQILSPRRFVRGRRSAGIVRDGGRRDRLERLRRGLRAGILDGRVQRRRGGRGTRRDPGLLDGERVGQRRNWQRRRRRRWRRRALLLVGGDRGASAGTKRQKSAELFLFSPGGRLR